MQHDVIVIGSGPAGVHAALPLVEAGLNVLMIDGGMSPATEQPVTNKNFEDVRREDAGQDELFLGRDYSSIPVDGLSGGHGGGMTSGNRSYVLSRADEQLPVNVINGQIVQSLAEGGLGAAWGAASAYMSDANLRLMGLNPREMDRFYNEITDIIGVSGPETREGIQPAMPPDHHADFMLKRAEKKREALYGLGVDIVQPHSAVLTQDKNGRKATSLADMDYYADPGKSVYRPQYTLDKLKQKPNFTYAGGNVVQYVEETAENVIVFAQPMDDRTMNRRWAAKRVIVAAGAINTARILLRSNNLFDVQVPIIAKPHMFAACIRPSSLGKKGPAARSSLCQLFMIDGAVHGGPDSGCAQLYSYRSLLLFRLLGNAPLPVPEALGLLSMYAPSLMIADIRFPGLPRAGQHLTLRRSEDARGVLDIHFTPGRTHVERLSLKRITRAMRMTGLLPVKIMDLPEGSSSHYAGTVPVADGRTLPLSSDTDGRVNGSGKVFVADASMFRTLPSLPHTLTIMANARRIGGIVGKTLNA